MTTIQKIPDTQEHCYYLGLLSDLGDIVSQVFGCVCDHHPFHFYAQEFLEGLSFLYWKISRYTGELMLENVRLIAEVLSFSLRISGYTGALFDTDHTPPSYPPFDFQISHRLDQSSQKLLTGSPAAYPPHTHTYLLVGAIESSRPLQSHLAPSVTKASSSLDCYQLRCQSYVTTQVVDDCDLDMSPKTAGY